MYLTSNCVVKGLGDNATAAMLRAAADKLSALVRSKLYVGGDAGGFWACEQPDGRLVQVRHPVIWHWAKVRGRALGQHSTAIGPFKRPIGPDGRGPRAKIKKIGPGQKIIPKQGQKGPAWA